MTLKYGLKPLTVGYIFAADNIYAMHLRVF